MTTDDLAHFLIYIVAAVVALLGSADAWAVVDWRRGSPRSREHHEEAYMPGGHPERVTAVGLRAAEEFDAASLTGLIRWRLVEIETGANGG